MNDFGRKIRKGHIYLTLGMGLGLTITGSAGLHPVRTNIEHRSPKYRMAVVGIGKPYPLLPPRRNVIDRLRVDADVRKLFTKYQDISAFFQKIEEWVEFFYNRTTFFEDFSNVTSGIVKVELTPVSSPEPIRDRKLRFKIKGTDQLAFKLRLTFGNGRSLERCVIAKENHSSKAVLLKEVVPVSRIVATPRGVYFCRAIKTMEATAYYPGPECTGESCDGLTSTGKKARFGIIAVDPKVIPLGTKVYIQGYGFAEAEDVGGAIKGNRIDLCFNTYREAVRFGRKKMKVFILD